jgi:hypothetical protein
LELTLYAALFGLWQCAASLAPGAIALTRHAGRWTLRRGPGWCLLSPWPGDPGLVLEAPGFELGDGRVFAVDPPARHAESAAERGVALDPEPRIERAGAVIRVGGGAFLRASSEGHAEEQERRLRAALREWREAPGRLPREIEASLSLAELRRELGEVVRATRWLRALCQLYFLLVFAAPPLLAWRLGADGGWLAALPAIGAVHLTSVVALGFAQRRALPPSRRRRERLVGSALFPPALLRAPAELVAARLVAFHPATAAAALLGEDAFVRMLRSELGRLDLRAAGPPTGPAADGRAAWRRGVREGLLSLCEQRGIDRGHVLAPVRVEPGAKSYCPVCLDEFLVVRAQCRGCGAASIAYPALAEPIARPSQRG